MKQFEWHVAGNVGDFLQACILSYKRSLRLQHLRDARRELAYFEAVVARQEHQAQLRFKRRMYRLYTEAIARIEARRRESLSG